MTSKWPSPSVLRQYRLEFFQNSANYSSAYCDACFLRNFSGPKFICNSCDNYLVCQKCLPHLKQFHDASHTFKLSITTNEQQLKHIGITCGGCQKRDFTGPRYNCQQCLNSFDLCQQCIPQAAVLHSSKHTFVSITTQDNETVHKDVLCHGCQTKPIIGLHFKCQSCPNFDLCHRCYIINRVSERKIHDATHEFQPCTAKHSSNDKPNDSTRADQAIARIRAKYGPEYNGNAVDAETGWSIADARVMQQQDFQLAMARIQSSLICSNAILSAISH